MGGTRAYNKEIGEHMERVHDYHELKDVAQALMGRLATIEGVLTRDLYKRYAHLSSCPAHAHLTHTRDTPHDTPHTRHDTQIRSGLGGLMVDEDEDEDGAGLV